MRVILKSHDPVLSVTSVSETYLILGLSGHPWVKKSVSCRPGGQKMASREVGKSFFLQSFLLGYTDGIEKKKLFSKIMGKKVQVGPFQPTRVAHWKQLFI